MRAAEDGAEDVDDWVESIKWAKYSVGNHLHGHAYQEEVAQSSCSSDEDEDDPRVRD